MVVRRGERFEIANRKLIMAKLQEQIKTAIVIEQVGSELDGTWHAKLQDGTTMDLDTINCKFTVSNKKTGTKTLDISNTEASKLLKLLTKQKSALAKANTNDFLAYLNKTFAKGE